MKRRASLAGRISTETREQNPSVNWERLDSFKNIKENSQDMGLRQKELSLVNSTVSASWEIGDNLKQIANENTKSKGVER
jgi:hypothetical protein